MRTKQDRSPQGREQRSGESVDGRMVCRMRLVLALSALLIIWIDPSEPDRHVAATYAALLLYSAYSGLLYLLSLRKAVFLKRRAVHWLDVGWYLLLIALSSGTGSIFFFFFFFSVIVASFNWGFAEGFRVAVVSALLFTAVGVLAAPAGRAFELNRFLLRPIYLLALGYMLAYWGGFEIELKRRLELLKDVNTLSNPRFGISHTIGSIMKRVRAFYDADACLLVLRDSSGEQFRLTRVGREDAEAHTEVVPAAVAQQFLSVPENTAVVYNGGRRWWHPNDERFYACDLVTGEETGQGVETAERVAAALDADSFISVPILYAGQSVGRAYLAGCRGDFQRPDVGFLVQIIEHVIPVLNNVLLLDRLASSAAEQERQKIARDIHDSVIQPYIGLQYKVAAIRNKLASDRCEEVAADLDHLFDVTVGEITGLRSYVRGLKEAGANRDDLLSAVRRYVSQFRDSYGIDVRVEAKTDINVNDRLAAELIQMVHEGLSNVRKHTEATSCAVSFECRGRKIVLTVENENGSARPVAPFVPRSISERAEGLGGCARVESDGRGATVVRVEIPL